ncbi:MAG: type II toxin-antitoxin system VapC family toxin [Candidatus Saccharimonadales bacterium]
MVYLDSNILIYLFEHHPQFGRQVADIISGLQPTNRFICSTLTVTECLAQVTKITLKTFHELPQLDLIPLDEAVANQAATLQRDANLRIGDAIHLATALQEKADLFLTNDLQLAKIAQKYLKVQILDK